MNLSFIWHMHQPDYRDSSGIIQMPWVFLHAIKDYYDMPWMLSRHSSLKATFNITPPLISQLKLYFKDPQDNDRFLNLWIKDLIHLNEDDRKWIIKICKSTPYETMVVPFTSYEELYQKEHFSDRELFDMQVLFVLSWCGIYLRTHNNLVKTLIKKERNYNQEDKQLLLNELSNFVSTIFDYYKELHENDVISISTTPLNHPILPLLLDMQNAIKANPTTVIPKKHIPLEEDAREQVKRAISLFKDTFGFTPNGFWPAEGAVDEKSVALLKECGIKWIATDEAILFKSLKNSDRNNLYTPYNYNDMCIGFRDHSLSDNIGFTYRYWEADKASDHFISSLAKINESNHDATVFIILDGENAWEFFQNNGFDFFDSLYSKLKENKWCNTIHMEDVVKLPSVSLDSLSPGSWIHGEFNTWIGHREKTRGWELIYMTKRDFEHHKASLNDETIAKITEHFLAAECSDWFWWYGDDHFTDFGSEFDVLFRSHLISVYDIMNITPPSDLFESIIKDRSSKNFWLKPQSHISPMVNGVHDSFFEWIGCGVIDESKLFSTMDRVRGPIRKILYGQDDEYMYFAFDYNTDQACKCDTINVIIDPIEFNEKISFESVKDLNHKEKFGDISVEIIAKNWLEIRIEKKHIGIEQVQMRFELLQDNVVIQTLPGFGELEINLQTDYSENWFV
ncbi:glycoside hydrolase [Sulfurimonas sp.]|uniref:glycoside hydrolase n=1 Tax=Sulfurimonas sp. TaxID=2022749 RepID=UPI003567021D